MIAPLRRRHRLVVTCLAVLLPVGLVAAVGARVDPPVVERLPAALVTPGRPADLPARAPEAAVTLDGRRLTFHGAGDALWVDVSAGGPARADALLLWSPVAPDGDALPADARFLGALGDGARSFRLPLVDGGALLLYSLAHAELVAVAPLPRGLVP